MESTLPAALSAIVGAWGLDGADSDLGGQLPTIGNSAGELRGQLEVLDNSGGKLGVSSSVIDNNSGGELGDQLAVLDDSHGKLGVHLSNFKSSDNELGARVSVLKCTPGAVRAVVGATTSTELAELSTDLGHQGHGGEPRARFSVLHGP